MNETAADVFNPDSSFPLGEAIRRYGTGGFSALHVSMYEWPYWLKGVTPDDFQRAFDDHARACSAAIAPRMHARLAVAKGGVHFSDWKVGERMAAIIDGCIRCGSPEGHSMVFARVRDTPDGLGDEGIGNQLCPKCKAGLDDAMHKEIDRLDVKLRAHLKTLGCPCCEAGLTCRRAPQVH